MDSMLQEAFDDTAPDVGAYEDEVRDAEADQVFDDRLTQEVEQRDAIIAEPDEPSLRDDDDEKEPDDSGVGDSDGSEVGVAQMADEFVPASSATTYSVGRGRYGKIAVDMNNQPLPPPSVRLVAPEEGFYAKQGRIPSLPIGYHIKRETPEATRARQMQRAPVPLINFEAKFNEIIIIIDKDDGQEKKGYHHAVRRLEEAVPDLPSGSTPSPHEIWSFGLLKCSLIIPTLVSCDLLRLYPDGIDNDTKRPFWFMFKRPPVFKDRALNESTATADALRGSLCFLDRATFADLSYGALTGMHRFQSHKDFLMRKRSSWTVRFLDEFFEIQSNVFERHLFDTNVRATQIKYKVPIAIIDRAAVFYLRNDGFVLFINMKGNVHELQRKYRSDRTVGNYERFQRQGIRQHHAQPLFPTIRLRVLIKDEQHILTNLERDKDVPADDRAGLVKLARLKSIEQIRDIFRNFLDFFHKNRIHVCFGSVYSKDMPLDRLYALNAHRFPTFIRAYSWTMLMNANFRLQVQLSFTRDFFVKLRDYSHPLDDDEASDNIDDRFYRLFLYLHRRSSEYFFLDLDTEVEIGIAQYKVKYERAKRRHGTMTRFNEPISETAYVPSVILTPTMISIRPLKLCKLNRILREPRFGGFLNFALVELRDEAQSLLFATEYRALRGQIRDYLTNGFEITPSYRYKYLHHSQSQVKSKQFWFYYHDSHGPFLSHADAYTWMGNFDKERVVAKHTARIALCFTSTEATIQITADKVTYVRDVKDPTGKYAFSDGVGTISTPLRDAVQHYLGRRYAFSVVQLRYGGCKGTLSVDPRLDHEQYEMRIRDSMNKFTSDHDILEVCKLSAPRALCLNRQDIVLLESRNVPDTNFLLLQNREHQSLIRSLLTVSVAYELLQQKLLPVFKLRRIARHVNIVEEQFFVKLIITCAFNVIRELLDRTRIRIPLANARNMFGIVDEYRVLEYGQVFVQYSTMREEKLFPDGNEVPYYCLEDDTDCARPPSSECRILRGRVVITKNPCHHPGDLRVFEAVDVPQLRHLKDVVVFPQKGHRPHSNEISGSDLDGDEYVVIWSKDLIPTTPNEEAYNYDSQEDPPKMDRPINRDDIIQVVMDVSEQDCLGSLANIHLAYVDRDGIKSKICTDLAGAISQEVDAAKTGKHPLTDEEIMNLRKGLENKWPDFMKARGKKEYYPSKRVLGKLYRSARRAVSGWSRAISNQGNPRHIHLALARDADTDELVTKTRAPPTYRQPLDPYITHPNYRKYLPEIKILYSIYRQELLEIISVYRFQDEVDLLCRCDSMDASGGGGAKKGSLEDSAAIELQNLVERTRKEFFAEFDDRRSKRNCCRRLRSPDTGRLVREDCRECDEDKLAKAACAYIYSYEVSNDLSLLSNRRILSFPWYFCDYLIRLKYRNRPLDFVEQKNTLAGRAISIYLADVIPTFQVFLPANFSAGDSIEFRYTTSDAHRSIPNVSLLRACFVEALHDWLTRQKIFGETCNEIDDKPLVPESIWHELLVHFLADEYQPNVRLLPASKNPEFLTERYRQTMLDARSTWTPVEHAEFHELFRQLNSLLVKHINRTKSTLWTYLHEYVLLALQCIAIEKRLVDKWI